MTDGDIPAYVRDGVERQDLDTLRAIRDLVDELIEERSEPDLDDVDDEDLVDADALQGGGSTDVVKKVACGKENCSTCPHGPYRYTVTWNGSGLDWSYEGPVDGDADA